ncbi:SDR family NAD(P)-dependent oxidoreductase [Compostimonas suwonensis]|uniref:Short-subunit dehydrogenase n=1 Tax=Compostimonas suwonensis TaxID=1048394 RepID=A0A2M9C4H1_9MICO|nr:SDR family NAD(P)-dependent oxidoreductase [Compostimonas suwonensis]PJJ65431.1 short-subunit dehydrogenase [Compostimonas suwonensis]
MTRTVAGATVLITGAAMGMGRLYAERAVREGARHVILWDHDRPALAATLAELRAAASGATAVHSHIVDLSDLGSIAQAAQKVRKDVGNPDVLVNNAGIVRGALFWEHDNGADTRTIMQVNALAPMYVTREFLPGMLARPYRAARILNVASAAGMLSQPRMSVYAASKWAVIGWSDSLRLELEREDHGNVKVTTAAPSFISTGMFEGARGPMLTPVMTPDYVVDRVWRAMLAGRPSVLLPWSVGLARVLTGVLPVRVWDAVAGRMGVYDTMNDFTGRD